LVITGVEDNPNNSEHLFFYLDMMEVWSTIAQTIANKLVDRLSSQMQAFIDKIQNFFRDFFIYIRIIKSSLCKEISITGKAINSL
jgi:hypothetical protein